jgi:hypothetical protein
MIGDYVYEELLHEVSEKRTIESQIVQLGDKLDALGESFHEVLAGNMSFVTNVVNHYGRIPTPLEYLLGYFQTFEKRCSELGALLPEILPAFPLSDRDWVEVARNGTSHTPESIDDPTGFAAYDFWKQALLKRDRERQIGLLTTKVE